MAPVAPATPVPGQPMQVAGVVSVVTLDDLAQGTSKLEYQLEDAQSHRHVALHFDGAPPQGLRSGTYLEVSGLAGDDSNVLSVGSELVSAPVASLQGLSQDARVAGVSPDRAGRVTGLTYGNTGGVLAPVAVGGDAGK